MLNTVSISKSNAIFNPSEEIRNEAMKKNWDAFRSSRDQILSNNWEDIILPAEELGKNSMLAWDEHTNSGVIRLPKGTYESDITVNRDAPFFGQMLQQYGMPKQFAEKLVDTRDPIHRELFEYNMMNLMKRPLPRTPDSDRMVRVIEGSNGPEAMALLSGQYLRLDHGPVMESIERWGQESNLVPMRTIGRIGDISVSLVQPLTFATELKRDDKMAWGVSIRNSMVGGCSFEVSMFLYRLACTNGMIATDFLGNYSRRHITGKRNLYGIQVVSEKEQKSIGQIMANAYDKVQQAINPEAVDAITQKMTTLQDTTAEERLEILREMRGRMMESRNRQEDAAKVLSRNLELNEGEAISVLNRWLAEPDATPSDEPTEQPHTAWGMMNAMTSVARDLALTNATRAEEIETLAGKMSDTWAESPSSFQKLGHQVAKSLTK